LSPVLVTSYSPVDYFHNRIDACPVLMQIQSLNRTFRIGIARDLRHQQYFESSLIVDVWCAGASKTEFSTSLYNLRTNLLLKIFISKIGEIALKFQLKIL